MKQSEINRVYGACCVSGLHACNKDRDQLIAYRQDLIFWWNTEYKPQISDSNHQ